MTDVLDGRSRATLSDDEVFGWPSMSSVTGGLLSGREMDSTVFGGRPGQTTWAPANPPSSDRRTRDLVEPLLWLTDDWDGHGAAAPSVKALQITTRFLNSLPDNLSVPDVMSSVTGGVLVEWETAEIDLIIEVEKAGAVSVYVRQGDSDEEGPLSYHETGTAEALTALLLNSH